MEGCVRRKQRNRAVRDIRVRLDRDNLSHGEGLSYACALHRRQKGDAEPGDVEGRTVVAVPIEATVWAPEPASPPHRIGSVVGARGAVGPGLLPAMRARMRGAGRGFRTKADAPQVAFVAQEVPDIRARRRMVPPIAPLAAYA